MGGHKHTFVEVESGLAHRVVAAHGVRKLASRRLLSLAQIATLLDFLLARGEVMRDDAS